MLVVVILLTIGMAAPASAQPGHPTGLDRARQATQQGLENAKGKDTAAPGQDNRARGLDEARNENRLRGRERAAAVINRNLQRGNGKGNAFGRGHAADVLATLLAGGSPSELAGEHGAAVRAMVHAYNELKRQQRAAG